MNPSPPTTRRHLDPEVAKYIDNYAPTLTAAQWTSVGPTTRELVALTLPPTSNDARVCLGHTARYLLWVLPRAGTHAPDAVMTTDWVERYCRENPYNLGKGTLSKQREVLRRALRALGGDQACTRRQSRPDGAAPYNPSELAALESVAAASGTLAAVLDVARTGSMVPTGGFGDLDAARLEAATTGVALRADRLRATATAATLCHHPTVHAAITAGGLTRAALTGVLPHLPRPDDETAHVLLRG